ncbi:hypothetical protein F5Y13DRAFT_81451 [Hypoxylon sp. FL1857]|nr:hypothetical protein F5Y13DRAFT_81451 [Hypoxylon sp. FL1857]
MLIERKSMGGVGKIEGCWRLGRMVKSATTSRCSNRFPIHETRAFKAAFAFHSSGRRRLRVEGVIRGLYENRRTGRSGDYLLR